MSHFDLYEITHASSHGLKIPHDKRQFYTADLRENVNFKVLFFVNHLVICLYIYLYSDRMHSQQLHYIFLLLCCLNVFY